MPDRLPNASILHPTRAGEKAARRCCHTIKLSVFSWLTWLYTCDSARSLRIHSVQPCFEVSPPVRTILGIAQGQRVEGRVAAERIREQLRSPLLQRRVREIHRGESGTAVQDLRVGKTSAESNAGTETSGLL